MQFNLFCRISPLSGYPRLKKEHLVACFRTSAEFYVYFLPWLILQRELD